jgi:hypothetical protein
LSEDAVFELLYREAPAAPEAPAVRAQLVSLATEWARGSGTTPVTPADIAARLTTYEEEATRSGRHGRYRLITFSRDLAAAVERPEDWLDAFLYEGLYDRAAPFLAEDVARRRPGWERRLESALTLDPLVPVAAALVLRLAEPAPDLLRLGLEEAARTPLLAEALAREGAVPLPTLRELFHGARWQTALAAALGEWMAQSRREVRAELRDDWQRAVLRARTAEYEETPETLGLQYGLRLLFTEDPGLAAAWLAARLEDPDLPVYFSTDSPFATAIESLDRERRRQLLGTLHEAPILQSLLPRLVGGDPGLFRQLLRMPGLVAYHLAPLRRVPEAVWEELATAALDAAHDPREVAEASLFRPADPAAGIDRWQQRDHAFAAHPRLDLREVGHHGRQRVRDEVRRERERAAIQRPSRRRP